MRKVIFIILSILPIFMSTQCRETVITPPSETITNFIDEIIPDEISETMLLPETYNTYKLKWYLDQEELTDYLLIRPFLLVDSRHIIKMEVSVGAQKKNFEKPVDFIKYQYVSTIRINTNYQAINRETYVPGSVSVDNGAQTTLEATMKIRGRGNSTWVLYEKKPYRIKFDERQSVLGMKAAKDYVLLSEHGDKSLLRNFIVHKIAQSSELDYVFETRFVEVYLNNYYEGLYLLTEQVEVDKNRLSLEDSNLYNGGFMVELETWDRSAELGEEDVDWVEVDGRAYIIVHPDQDDYTEAEMKQKANYIKSYLQNTYQSMKNGTYQSYIDVEELMDYFIIQELTKNVDVNYSSVFMYKDYNGKLKMGPLWDFDISMGNGDYYPSNPEGFWAVNHPYLTELRKDANFKTQYKARFKAFLEKEQDWLNELDYAYQMISIAAANNFSRWNILDQYIWPNSSEMMSRHTHEEQYEYVREWLIDRIHWLNINMNSL